MTYPQKWKMTQRFLLLFFDYVPLDITWPCVFFWLDCTYTHAPHRFRTKYFSFFQFLLFFFCVCVDFTLLSASKTALTVAFGHLKYRFRLFWLYLNFKIDYKCSNRDFNFFSFAFSTFFCVCVYKNILCNSIRYEPNMSAIIRQVFRKLLHSI